LVCSPPQKLPDMVGPAGGSSTSTPGGQESVFGLLSSTEPTWYGWTCWGQLNPHSWRTGVVCSAACLFMLDLLGAAQLPLMENRSLPLVCSAACLWHGWTCWGQICSSQYSLWIHRCRQAARHGNKLTVNDYYGMIDRPPPPLLG
jgi:hypothetical protein